MDHTPFWDEPLPPAMLTEFTDPLSGKQIDTLWSMFVAIDTHWRLGFPVNLLRSRWLDMIEARRGEDPDYTAEYDNAVRVFEAMGDVLGREAAIEKFYLQTKIVKVEEALTRLGHAKFFVGNDFIRCFIACGGFRGFVSKARNYTGFMGGSRFREWPPVRTRPRP
jgi:hypothetical protein